MLDLEAFCNFLCTTVLSVIFCLFLWRVLHLEWFSAKRDFVAKDVECLLTWKAYVISLILHWKPLKIKITAVFKIFFKLIISSIIFFCSQWSSNNWPSLELPGSISCGLSIEILWNFPDSVNEPTLSPLGFLSSACKDL